MHKQSKVQSRRLGASLGSGFRVQGSDFDNPQSLIPNPQSVRQQSTIGLTLIEVLVATTIATIFYGALYGFYRLHIGALRTEEIRITLQESSRLALDFMVRELRLAGARPLRGTLCDGFERFTVAEEQAVTLQYDFRGNQDGAPPDGCPDDPSERITYSYNSPQRTLRRATGGGSPQPLISDVPADGFLLRYFDRNGNELAAPLDADERTTVHSLTILVHTRHRSPDPLATEPIRSELSSTVFLPNPPR